MGFPKRVVIFADWYEPGFQAGGPIRSIVNLVAKIPLEFWVITSNSDHNSKTPYEDIPSNTWVTRANGEQVIYLDQEHQNKKFIASLLKEVNPEVLYINSLFSPKFALIPLMINKRQKRKVVLAPRGMLKAGALSKKAFKKKIFLTLSKVLNLYSNITWHATNAIEKSEIQRFLPNALVKIAPNISSAMQHASRSKCKEAGKLNLVAICRVSEEKNILGGIEMLKHFDTQHDNITWDVFGTLENQEYLARCKAQIKTFRWVKVNFKGDIAHDQIPSTLSEYDFLFLPTKGENYGHAIVESFLNGLPVIISDQTPWKGLSNEGVGWDLPLNELDKWQNILEKCLQMTEETHQKYRNLAQEKGSLISNDPEVIAMNTELFII